MIHKDTLSFLSDLEKNNHKEWFDANKARYQAARSNFLENVQMLIDGIGSFDEEILHAHLDPKKCIMRINRDIRFSNDKRPYKSNFFAFINRDGKKSPFGGYYLSIQPGESFFGTGIYMPPNPELHKIRQEIDYNLEEWDSMVESTGFKNALGEVKPSGELKRPPKGYAEDNPAIQWLKYKGYYTQVMLSDKELNSESFIANTISAMQKGKGFVHFINRAIAD